MFKQLYYFENVISDSLDFIESYIAGNEVYNGEEGLLHLFENEIGYIDTKEDLKQYSIEYGADYDELLKLADSKEEK